MTYGEIKLLPLAPGETADGDGRARAGLRPRRRARRADRAGEVSGGTVGLILDGRGRRAASCPRIAAQCRQSVGSLDRRAGPLPASLRRPCRRRLEPDRRALSFSPNSHAIQTMAQAYTPGLKVTNRVTHRCRRRAADQGRGARERRRPGRGPAGRRADLHARRHHAGQPGQPALDAARRRARSACSSRRATASTSATRSPETKGIFGFFKKTLPRRSTRARSRRSPAVTGQVIIRGAPIPVQVKAYLSRHRRRGHPDEGVVIEAEVTFVQGIFGVGGETLRHDPHGGGQPRAGADRRPHQAGDERVHRHRRRPR